MGIRDEMNKSSNFTHQLFFNPEDITMFNSARLLLLFEKLNNIGFSKPIDMERLSLFDFFSANPFLILDKNDPSWIELESIGFETLTIDYMSSSQRFRTKRSKLKSHLAFLYMKGLISNDKESRTLQLYSITEEGMRVASNFRTIYANNYRRSVEIVVKKLKGMSDTKLWKNSNVWLEARSFQIDLYDITGNINE